MASAYPVAAFLVIALFGLLIFPVAWWLLAYWQKQRKLSRLSRISIYWSITPIAGFIVLYLGANEILIPQMAAGIIFFLMPAVNVLALTEEWKPGQVETGTDLFLT